ncbi:MAG: SpoIIE family protein phosphatase [Bacteroidales bacterium]|nr:SpoIIE family protein phosphatase [Bacteroidales bacterium]MBN2818449.1 SpoIIE family protein phosphatase [Bacteroidales bacterium]
MGKLYRLIILLLFVFSSAFSQNENSIELISVSQGLPNSQITKLFFGSKGLLWIGTANGLCIYDGYSFKVQQSVPFDVNTLADDNIIEIVQDRNNQIWLHTHFGIEMIDPLTASKKRIKYFQDHSNIRSIIPSQTSNEIYFIYNHSVEICNSKTFEIETLPIRFLDELLDAVLIEKSFWYITKNNIQCYNIHTGNTEEVYRFDTEFDDRNIEICRLNGVIYFSLGNKLFSLNTKTYKRKLLYETQYDIVSFSFKDSTEISIATKNQVFLARVNSKHELENPVSVYNSQQQNINQVIVDNDEIVWIATDRGVVKVNPHAEKLKHPTLSELGFSEKEIINTVVEASGKGIIVINKSGDYKYFSAINDNFYSIPQEKYSSVCLIDNGIILAGYNQGLLKINLNSGEYERISTFREHAITSIEILDDELWVSTNKGIYKYENQAYISKCDIAIQDFIIGEKEIFFTTLKEFGMLDKNSCDKNIILSESKTNEYVKIRDLLQSYDGKIWLATDDGLYRFNPTAKEDNTELFKQIFRGKVYSLIEAKSLPEVWFSTDLGVGSVNYQSETIMFLGYEDGVRATSFIPSGAYLSNTGELNFITNNEVLSFHPDSIYRNIDSPIVEITFAQFISKNSKTERIYLKPDTIVISSDISYFELAYSTLDYYSPLQTIFEYSLVTVGKSEFWKPLKGNILAMGGISPGIYNLRVRARNSHGIGSENSLNSILIVKASMLESRMAYLIYGVILILFVVLLIRIRTRNLIRINREYKERERIAKKIEIQKEELSLKNKNITDSINYARRIQVAMMPSAKLFNTIFPDSFILHMPKDIVSGDFYWANRLGDKIFFSAVDCTGHGVPGAFMSIIGVELFRRITEIENIYTPAEVLNSLSKNFDRVFGDVEEMKLRDGMDLAFCTISQDYKVLEFSGAFNPLYIIRDSSIIEVKGDRQSVGLIHEDEEKHSFTNHVIPLQDQDLVYIFTDGFADQFGGPEGKKYKYRRFRHLLLALHQLPMYKQEEFLRRNINEWKGETDQVDDILVLGIRIHQQK